MIVDRNDFKQINDRQGHRVGDRILQDIAGYLAARVRASDTVARLGGDEFALILNHMADMTLHDWLKNRIDDFDGRPSSNADNGNPSRFLSIGAASIDARRYPSPGSGNAVTT